MRKVLLTVLVLTTILINISCSAVTDQTEDTSAGTTAASETAVQTEPGTTAASTDAFSTEGVIRPAETEPAPPEESGTTAETTGMPVQEGTFTPAVFMYHLISDEVQGPYDNLFVRPSEFESQVKFLSESGIEFLFAEDWHKTVGPSVMLTFDDGYLDNYTNMFPILKKYNAKATVFVIKDFVGREGYMNEDQIKEMSASGLVSIQSHTSHHNDLTYSSREQLIEDLSGSVEYIEALTGREVRSLAYPAGSYNELVMEVTSEIFDFAYTTKYPGNVETYTNYEIPRYRIYRGDTDQNIRWIFP